MLHLQILGTYHASFEDNIPLQFQTDKGRALLAYLALQGENVMHRPMLATLLWTDSLPKSARSNLRKVLHRLRQTLGDQADELLLSAGQTLRLNSAEVTSDAQRFGQLLNRVEQHSHSSLNACTECIARLREASELYAGDLLTGLSLNNAEQFHVWLRAERERLYQRMLWALSELTDAELQLGRASAAQRYAQRQLALEPWRERAYGQLMIALARQGQTQAAFKQYDVCRDVLLAELGIEPSVKLRAILSNIYDRVYKMEDASAEVSIHTPLVPQHNLLAHTTPFFDRIIEQTQLIDLLKQRETRWVTLVGEGGVGKSRLAQQVGHALLPHFADGVWFVPLTGLDGCPIEATPRQSAECQEVIATAIAAALQLQLRGATSLVEQLAAALQQKQLLLILDNWEHLLGGAAMVKRLLESVPELAILCTSRVALQYSGEFCFFVEGLAVPVAVRDEDESADSPAPKTFPSIQLFADRARRVSRHFTVSAENIAPITNICRWVGGNALGIELAAAWMRYQSAEAIWTQLQTSSERVLRSRLRDVPTRHSSMQVVFEQSWALLAADLQQTLAQLSIFRNDFDADAAYTVADADINSLYALVECSLVQHQDGRFWLHAALRQFSAGKLSSAEQYISGKRHSTYYLYQVAQQADALRRDMPQHAVAQIARDEDNVRAAWHFAQKHALVDALLNAQSGYSHYLQMQGRAREACALFAEAASEGERLARQVEGADQLAMRSLIEKARFSNRLSQYETAQQAALNATTLAMRLEDGWAVGMGLIISAESYWRQHRLAEATRQLQLVQASLEFDEVRGWYHFHTGIVHDLNGDAAAATASLHEALAVWQARNDSRGQQTTLNSLGLIALSRGDLNTAHDHLMAALTIADAIGDRSSQAVLTCNIGWLHCENGVLVLAETFAFNALNLAKQTRNRAVMARSYELIAQLKAQSAEVDAARQYAHRAKDAYMAVGLTQNMSSVEQLLNETLHDAPHHAKSH